MTAQEKQPEIVTTEEISVDTTCTNSSSETGDATFNEESVCTSTYNLQVGSFNCKNLATSALLIEKLMADVDILLLQEHWLFNYQLNSLMEISDTVKGAGKAVDDDNPIPPVQKPRGYGGVAVLWKKEIDNEVTILKDGNTRIQCISIKTNDKPILVASVYLPAKGANSNIQEFQECIDQLDEIVSKYSETHNIIIGGDLNEEISKSLNSDRNIYVQTFIRDNCLDTVSFGATFVHANGRDSSEIDHFLFTKTPTFNIIGSKKLCNLATNVSDHHPIMCTLEISSNINKTKDVNEEKAGKMRVRWDKVDMDLYSALVDQGISNLISLVPGTDTVFKIGTTIEEINNILTEAADIAYEAPKKRKSKKSKLNVWNSNIKEALAKSKEAHRKYKIAVSDNTLSDEVILDRKLAKRELRSSIRCEQALQRVQQKENLMEARTHNRTLFYKIIREQRGSRTENVTEIKVGETTFKGAELLTGWKEHFKAMTTQDTQCIANSDRNYTNQVQSDVELIRDICEEDTSPIVLTNPEEVRQAVKKLNTGKAPDAYGVSTENIIYASDSIFVLLAEVYNIIFRLHSVPDVLKLGTVTPVFKKKGSKLESKNYRGITVLPVLAKLLEILLRSRIRIVLDPLQNPMQRGSSPLNCALLIEEFIRESMDNSKKVSIALLDAKAAFDVVNHASLMRKLYIAGIEGDLWSVINSLQHNAISSVKWEGDFSEAFHITQGVRQGGILSADMYKLYINSLLDRIEHSGIGGHIGDVVCSAPTCADDMSQLSNTDQELQILCNMAKDYSNMELYSLQPTKSVVLPIHTNRTRRNKVESPTLLLGEDPMPTVEKAVHVGVTRTSKHVCYK